MVLKLCSLFMKVQCCFYVKLVLEHREGTIPLTLSLPPWCLAFLFETSLKLLHPGGAAFFVILATLEESIMKVIALHVFLTNQIILNLPNKTQGCGDHTNTS